MADRTLPSPSKPIGLLAHLLMMLSDTKRSRIKTLLRSGLVHVNGTSITQHDQEIGADDVIEIRTQRAAAQRSFPFDVLFEDAMIIVIDKPNGLLTVGNKYEKNHTVESIVNQALAEHRQRCYIVQRLDLYTSGVLLLAKTELSQSQIKKNWGTSEKLYHAVVEGVPEPPQASLTHFLKEDDRLVVHAHDSPGRDTIKATLSYETLKSRDDHTLVRIRLKTGKKNQIRAQCQRSAIPSPVTPNMGRPRIPLDACAFTHRASLSPIRKPTNGYPSNRRYRRAWIFDFQCGTLRLRFFACVNRYRSCCPCQIVNRDHCVANNLIWRAAATSYVRLRGKLVEPLSVLESLHVDGQLVEPRDIRSGSKNGKFDDVHSLYEMPDVDDGRHRAETRVKVLSTGDVAVESVEF